jgi:CRISPR-associated protein Csx10
MKLFYRLTTVDPIILSQNNSSKSVQSLDYIAGSALLGAVASKLYPTLDAKQSFCAFQNSGAHFGPAYPVKESNGQAQVCLPIPASWHAPKGQDNILSNHSAASFSRAPSVQYKQKRDGFITNTGESPSVKCSVITKTALDSSTGKAKNGQLFNYTQIDKGQTFAGFIHADDASVLESIKSILNKSMRLGRSRGSEFGRVKIELLDLPESQENILTKKSLTLWCLSDVQCFDKFGEPTCTPSLEELAPTLNIKATLNSSKSFIRSRNVSLFNQARGGLDSEQVLISKGSVLTFDLTSPLSKEELNTLEKGVGLNQQQGLGWVSANPEWTDNAEPNHSHLFSAISLPITKTALSNKTDKALAKTSKLTQWAAALNTKQETRSKNESDALELIRRIINAYRNVRSYNRIFNSRQIGPTSTQWRRVNDTVRGQTTDYKAILFNGDHAICKAKNDEDGWGVQWQQESKLKSLSSYFEDLMQNTNADILALALEKMVRYDLSEFTEISKCEKELNLNSEANSNKYNNPKEARV